MRRAPALQGEESVRQAPDALSRSMGPRSPHRSLNWIARSRIHLRREYSVNSTLVGDQAHLPPCHSLLTSSEISWAAGPITAPDYSVDSMISRYYRRNM